VKSDYSKLPIVNKARMLYAIAQAIYYEGHLVVRESLFSASVKKKYSRKFILSLKTLSARL